MRDLERIVNGAVLTCAACGRPARLQAMHVETDRDEGHRAMPYHDPILTGDVTEPLSRSGERSERSARTREQVRRELFQPISRVA